MVLHSIGRSEGPEQHQSVDCQIHLSRRLHPGAIGGAAGDRARRPAGHRHRDPAPALCGDAARPGASASSRIAKRSSGSTTRASYACGSSISPAAEMAFREQNMMVMQIQLTKRQGVVPITRDYMGDEEARLRGLEGGAARRCGLPASSAAISKSAFVKACRHASSRGGDLGTSTELAAARRLRMYERWCAA